MVSRSSSLIAFRKVIISIVFAGLAIGLLQYFFVERVTERAQQSRKEQLRQLVELGYNAVHPYIHKIQRGELTPQAALPHIRETLRRMTFTDHTGTNYLFMSTYSGVMLVQPFEAAMEGTSQINLQDSDGTYLIKELITAAKTHPKGTFVRYRYNPPNSSVAQNKISFVLGIPEIQSYIGTGMYVDDLEAQARRELVEATLFCFLAVLAFATPILLHIRTMSARTDQLEQLQESNEATLKQLRLTETKYHTILENTLEGIVIVQNERLHLLNSSLNRLTGYPLKELEGADLSNLIHPDDLGLVRDRHRRRVAGEHVPTQYPVRIRSATEKTKWVLLNTVRIMWEDKPASLAMLTDISDLKEAQETLEDRETKFRSLMEQAPIPIAILNMKGYLLDMNKQWANAWLQAPPSQLGQYNILEDDQLHAHGLIPEIRKAFQGQTIITQPVPLSFDADETHNTRWIILRLYPIVSQRGDINSIVLMHEDQTEHIIAEQRQTHLLQELSLANKELRQTQGVVKDIIDSMPSALICVDKQEQIILWNQAASALFNTTEFEALNQPLHTISPRLAFHLPSVRQAQRDMQPKRIERSATISSGSARYEDVVIYPLTIAGNQGAVIRIDDVTERARLEEMMIQTEKMMSVGGLAAGMAHEINNPLGGILQGEQNIRRRLLKDIPANKAAAQKHNIALEDIRGYLETREIPSFLETIREAGERAAHIVTHMLSFSRQSNAELIPTDIPPLMDQTLELAKNDYSLEKGYDFKRVEIVRDYDDNLPKAACTPSEIEQVFLNILKNAVQSLADGPSDNAPPTITVSVTRAEKMIRTRIADNGPGMTEEQKHRAFEPFYTTKEVGIGTGLGLSVSFFIISTRHHGTMHIESAPGKGATFIIDIPIA